MGRTYVRFGFRTSQGRNDLSNSERSAAVGRRYYTKKGFGFVGGQRRHFLFWRMTFCRRLGYLALPKSLFFSFNLARFYAYIIGWLRCHKPGVVHLFVPTQQTLAHSFIIHFPLRHTIDLSKRSVYIYIIYIYIQIYVVYCSSREILYGPALVFNTWCHTYLLPALLLLC